MVTLEYLYQANMDVGEMEISAKYTLCLEF